jgi:glycosyltransferase involved in cell wall biosynthesis
LLTEAAHARGARRVVNLPNGVDPRRFLSSYNTRPPDIAGIPSPKVIYAGSVESWFDWESVCSAARSLSNVSFVILGSTTLVPADLPSNVHLLGLKPHHELAGFMAQADAAIIPFKELSASRAVAAIDPIKLWEYLVCGLPVVASSALELPDMPGLVWRYGSRGEFVDGLRAALARGRKPDGEANICGRTWKDIVIKALSEVFESPPS